MEPTGPRNGPRAANDVKNTSDDEFDREIRAHLELDADERVAHGLTPEEARSSRARGQCGEGSAAVGSYVARKERLDADSEKVG